MDVTEEDQDVDQGGLARYGNTLKPGKHDFDVLEVKEGFTAGGADKVVVTLVTADTVSEQDAPDGPVKIDYHCVRGQYSLRNLIETFEPAKLGKKATLDLASYAGKRVKATTKWEPARNKPGATPEQIADGSGTFKAKAAIVKLIGPATTPKKVEDAF